LADTAHRSFVAVRTRFRRLSIFAAFSVLSAPAAAQSNVIRRDTIPMINRSSNPLLANFRFRSIGPASMGGRVDDIAVYEKDPRIIWVGYAVGGVFKSMNGGTTFAPVFEKYGSASIGDIAVDQTNPNVAWVGTGEPNNRQTSSFGDGIYKTTDGGKTFTNVGLRETQTIGRIVIDPKKPDVVYVAAPGHLFGPSPDRGVYKTTDGGKTWNKIKYIDENTGFTDIAIDPTNSNILYAASYQRRRTGCCFNGGGPGSGLWKTDDAGRTWTRLASGLPSGPLGRIALDVARSNPNVVYAQIENEGTEPAAANAPGNAEGAPAGGGRGGYDWCNNGGPGRGFGGGAGGGGGAPTPPVDTTRKPPALSSQRPGLYRSENKGRTWTLVSNCNGRPLYFSNIRVDPTNDRTLYVANTRAAKSIDGGKTFVGIDEGIGFGNEMVDQHAYWIDPSNAKHLLRGADSGLAESWDGGLTWEYIRTMATGLAYLVTADMHRPYNIYFGLQDNDGWGGPSAARSRIGIRDNNWYRVSFENSGDGFQTAVDPTDRNIVYSEAQDGRAVRSDLRTGITKVIKPSAPPAPGAAAAAAGSCVDGRITAPGAGGRGGGGGGGGRGGATAANVVNARPGDAYRFNWNTPILLSPHNPSTIWMGGDRLFRSDNQGDMWFASADLTKHVDRCNVTVMGATGTTPQLSKNDGVTSYSTIIAISESPAARGVVWAGTDDGNLQISRDNGVTFTEVGKNITGLPANALSSDNPYWISRIDASHFDGATAYVAIDGHRSDDLKPYIFVTHDYGRTWTNLSGTLPTSGNVQVVREDPKNRNLLYAGTEFGLFISLDAGKTWEKFMNNYPTVRTDDILIHPRDGDLIAATHGRSIWIADDITPLQQWNEAVAASDATLFDVRPAVAYVNDIRLDVSTGGEKQFEGENPARGTSVNFYMKAAGDVKLTISDQSGRAVCESSVKAVAGINRVQWTLVAPLLNAAPGGGGRGGGRGGAGAANPASDTTGGRATAPSTTAGSCSGATGGRGGSGGGAAPGSYIAKLTVSGHDYVKPVTVLEDKWMTER
jgi:photosystem II stability/assembly factor-like uncharacterized protein